MTIRALLRLNANVIEICYDCRGALGNAPVDGGFDVDMVTNQLRELRDVLENLYISVTPIGAVGSTSRPLGPSEPMINELLSKCREEMGEIEAALKQENSGRRGRGANSSQGYEAILGNLSMSATDLKSLMGGNKK